MAIYMTDHRVGAASQAGYAILARAGRSIRYWLIVTLLILVALPMAANAITPLSQGFTADEAVSLGSIVSLKNNTTDHVVASSSSNADSILGVIINDGSSLLSLSNGQENQVQVATSGMVSVLVSDINGIVKQGDSITASPVKGVGMKATSNAKVVGIAQGSPINSNPEKHTYTDSEGKQHPIVLGEVPILINVSYYYKQPDKTIIPSAIQNVANALAGKTVNTTPILISGAIFIITLAVVVSIIYSMIRSSIISVGRNPMSQSAVYRDVIQLSALVLGILAVSLTAIYFILTRF
ncbi:MAG TPA: hypothetical protein VGO98_00325 [Candidatus Saccharimonadales bacterium]|jgi:hypothetical protein|nr:hypothetical protein [Candidatus Saccharimonadales bacterium]